MFAGGKKYQNQNAPKPHLRAAAFQLRRSFSVTVILFFSTKNNKETTKYGYVLHWLGVWGTFHNCDPTFGFWHGTLDCVWVPVALYPQLLSYLNVSDQRKSEEFKRSRSKKGSRCAEETISVKLPLPKHIVLTCQMTEQGVCLSDAKQNTSWGENRQKAHFNKQISVADSPTHKLNNQSEGVENLPLLFMCL